MVPEPGLNEPDPGVPAPPPAQDWPAQVPAPGHPQPQWDAPQPYPPVPAYFGPPPGSGPAPYVMPVSAPLPSALPTTQREYHEFFRTPRFRWWKPLAAIGMFVGGALVTILMLTPLILLDFASGRMTAEQASSGQLSTTPMLFLVNNLAIALWVPLSLLTAWAVFRQRPRWLSSIQGGFRWRLFGRFALIAFVGLALSTGIEVVLGGGFGDLAWNSDSLFLILTIVLTTPFQAAGEEYSLRGLGARSIAAWFGSRRVGLIVATTVTSLVFMVLHGAGDPWLNAFYLLFAVTSSVLVWRTGGLEASIALHVANNLISEATLPFSSISGIFDRQAGVAGPGILWQMGVVVVIAGVMLWQAHRLRLPRTAAPAAPVAPELSNPGGVFWDSSHTIA